MGELEKISNSEILKDQSLVKSVKQKIFSEIFNSNKLNNELDNITDLSISQSRKDEEIIQDCLKKFQNLLRSKNRANCSYPERMIVMTFVLKFMLVVVQKVKIGQIC